MKMRLTALRGQCLTVDKSNGFCYNRGTMYTKETFHG